jgi:aminopeptidase YwaD
VIERPFDKIQDRLRAHVQALVGERHPERAPASLERAADYLAREFRILNLAVTEHRFKAGRKTFRNVIGTSVNHPQSAQAAPLILAAHYDTVAGSPGADDNASGLAVMLETARILKDRLLRPGSGQASLRPVRCIAFCLEEEDLMGSRAYAAHLHDTNQTIHGAIVLECVGYARTEPGSQATPPGLPIKVPTVGDFLAIVGNEASVHLVAALQGSAKQMPSLKTIPLVVPGRGEALPDTRRSDHAAFWDHGFQAVMLTDTANFRNPHYHRPTDRIETLDFAFMEQVVGCLTAAAAQLAMTKD